MLEKGFRIVGRSPGQGAGDAFPAGHGTTLPGTARHPCTSLATSYTWDNSQLIRAVAQTPFILTGVGSGVMFDDTLERFRSDERGRVGGRGGVGLLGLLVIVGLILLVFPEPATSGIGVLLLVIALILLLL